MAGSWILTDDGEFILDPIYEERLVAIKTKLRDRWLETICCELSKETGYSEELLLDEFLSRCEKETDELPIDMVDSFIIEALEGSI